MLKTIKEKINIGAPIFSGVLLRKSELLAIADDKEKVEETFKKLNEEFDNLLHSKTTYKNIESDFIDSIVLKADKNDSITKVYTYGESFLTRILENLNTDESENIPEQLEKLTSIKTLEDLMSDFPALYKDYNKGEKIRKEYQLLRDFNNGTSEDVNKIKKLDRLYWSTGCRYVVEIFAKIQKEKYEKYLDFYKNHIESYSNSKLSYATLEGVNLDKLCLLLAHKYIQNALKTTKDDLRQKAIYYVMPYIRKYIDKNISLSLNDKDIDNLSILKDYRKLFSRHNDLVPLDTERARFEGLTRKESLDLIEKEKENAISNRKVPYINLGWSTIKILDSVTDEVIIDSLNKKYHFLTNEEREALIKRDIEIYNRKKSLLESSKFVEKFYGKEEEYNGYISYIYNNQIIIMEKFFESYITYTLARDEAAYKLDTDGFIRTNGLYTMSKSALIKDPSVRKIYHTKGYENKVKSYIELPTTLETTKNTEEFLNKIYTLEKIAKLK